MDNRRQFDRFELNIYARIEFNDGQKQVNLEVEASDLSAGGLLFQSDHPLPEGLPVKVILTLPFEELRTETDPAGRLVIKVTGHVLRSEADGTAITFHDDYDVSILSELQEEQKIR